jgi:[acyl-carrier-protein] S-malonyltransferase
MKLAFVFPGQGSQSVGMMSAYESLPGVRTTFETASAALGIDLWQLVQHGPEEELTKTVNTQPAMLAADIALFRAWRELEGPLPIVVAGHSLGEYGALVAAGVLDFAEAMKLVRFRAQAMQEAVPEGQGSMAAILGLDDAAVRSVCEQASSAGVAEAANFNSPGQVVIAGTAAGVQRAIELAKAAGAKRSVPIAMSVPSHCSLMRPVTERLRERLAGVELRRPALSLVNNVDAAIEQDPARIRDAMLRQLHNPVRWTESMKVIAGLGVSRIVECGPGAVLTTLNRRAAPGIKAIALSDAKALEDAVRDAHTAAA